MRARVQVAGIRLDNIDADRARRGHGDAIQELQRQPLAFPVFVANVELPNNVEVKIPHGLGRRYSFVWHSPPRDATSTAGLISEIREGDAYRPRQFVTLRALNLSAGSVYVDVMIA